ncbi:transcriptional coactivator p15/PC4 family protein [Mesotoga prima]|uniref:transcriptional coactivator p15/PC4 family protein n=1 Tax=Mesotoga prima TaxID=1184387 RepID=UPI002FDA6FAF
MTEIDKNSLEKIRIQRTNYKGKDLLDIRVFYEAENGEWKPTKKGITVKVALTEKLLDGITKEMQDT